MTTEAVPKTISAEAIVAAVNLVNDYRRKVGLEPLDDLPKGDRGDVHRCILARAFNFDCRVSPFGHEEANDYQFGGVICFKNQDIDKAKLLSKLLGTELVEHGQSITVDLTPELGKLARYFDFGWLPQYVEED